MFSNCQKTRLRVQRCLFFLELNHRHNRRRRRYISRYSELN